MKYHQIDQVQQAVLQAAKDGRLSHLKVVQWFYDIDSTLTRSCLALFSVVFHDVPCFISGLVLPILAVFQLFVDSSAILVLLH